MTEPKQTIYLMRPYRGWLSDRELWQPGKKHLPVDACTYLVNAGYAQYEPEKNNANDTAPTRQRRRKTS